MEVDQSLATRVQQMDPWDRTFSTTIKECLQLASMTELEKLVSLRVNERVGRTV